MISRNALSLLLRVMAYSTPRPPHAVISVARTTHPPSYALCVPCTLPSYTSFLPLSALSIPFPPDAPSRPPAPPLQPPHASFFPSLLPPSPPPQLTSRPDSRASLHCCQCHHPCHPHTLDETAYSFASRVMISESLSPTYHLTLLHAPIHTHIRCSLKCPQ